MRICLRKDQFRKAEIDLGVYQNNFRLASAISECSIKSLLTIVAIEEGEVKGGDISAIKEVI